MGSVLNLVGTPSIIELARFTTVIELLKIFMEDTTNVQCGIVGLGYVGLTLAINFDGVGFETIGYDVDEEKIEDLRDGHDTTGEYGTEAIRESDISFTTRSDSLGECDYVFLSLPTPVDESKTPDLSGLEAACETVGQHISDGTVISVESTIYPGATREVLSPAVERGTRAQGGTRFSIGYSPERIVPGGGKRFTEAVKLVSAEDESTLRSLGDVYERVVDAGVHLVETIETAEAAKCLENVQRDVNIGLVNEFTIGCRHLDFELDPYAVLEAAGTKWNFHEYRPGIVGGHCIPVDPHYLRHTFEEAGFRPSLIQAARSINQQMVRHVCSVTVDALCSAKAVGQIVAGSVEHVRDVRTDGTLPEDVAGSHVLLLGFGYKPDVADVRDSGVDEVAERLQNLGFRVNGYDSYHGPESVPDSFGFEVLPRLDFEGVDAIVVLAPHEELRRLDFGTVSDQMNENPVLVDVERAFDRSTVEAHGFTYQGL